VENKNGRGSRSKRKISEEEEKRHNDENNEGKNNENIIYFPVATIRSTP
jgi:hypothetical protein